MKPQIKRAGYFIGVTCPGCGGGLELQSDFRTIECEHCSSVLRISAPTDQPLAYYIKPSHDKRAVRFQVDRYLKKNHRKLTGSQYKLERLFFPYWKMDGITLKIRTERGKLHQASDQNILTAQIDYAGLFQFGRALGKTLTSTPAVTEDKINVKLGRHSSTISAGTILPGLPHSLGMRAEYIKLYPLADEEINKKFTYLPISLDWAEVSEILNKSIGMRAALFDANGPGGRDRVFGLKGSIIYFPYFILQMADRDEQSRFVIDALSGRIVHVGSPTESDQSADNRLGSEESVTGLAGMSGFGKLDISLHRCSNCGENLPALASFINICHNCQRVNLVGASDLFSGEVKVAGDGNQDDPLFPFWTIADRTTNETILIPAFEISNFEVMRRLARKVSAVVPEISCVNLTNNNDQLQAVTVDPEKAVQLAEIMRYCQKAVSDKPDLASPGKLIPEMMSLIYLPFHLRNYFYVDSINGSITFEKSAVPTSPRS